VVFPEPDSPTRPSTSPGRTANVIPLITAGPRGGPLADLQVPDLEAGNPPGSPARVMSGWAAPARFAGPPSSSGPRGVPGSSRSAASSGLRSTPRRGPPRRRRVSRLVPIVSRGDQQGGGMITGPGIQGPGRPGFSLIMVPQLGEGGGLAEAGREGQAPP